MDNLVVALGDHGGEKERAKAIARGLATASRTLLAGRCWGSLPELLESLGCDVTGVVFGPAARDEAQVACSAVEVINPGDRCFPEGLAPHSFDAIIFDDALEHFEQPSALLIDADRLLAEGGPSSQPFQMFGSEPSGSPLSRGSCRRTDDSCPVSRRTESATFSCERDIRLIKSRVYDTRSSILTRIFQIFNVPISPVPSSQKSIPIPTLIFSSSSFMRRGFEKFT